MPGLDGLALHARLKAAGNDLASRMLLMIGDAAGVRAADMLRTTGLHALMMPLRPDRLTYAIEELAG
jgi:DNA-binding NtrC family response regulator